MKKLALVLVVGSLAVVGAVAATASPARARAALMDAQGKKVGVVDLEQAPHGVLVSGTVEGLPAGEHAIHFHEVGKCEAPFTTAGGHFNPNKKDHGLKAPKGMHAGDLPNLVVPAEGKLKFELFTSQVSLKKGKGSVFDKDGTAVVIHARADDHVSSPAGNAGDRIACGVVTEAAAEAAPAAAPGPDAGTALPGNMGGAKKDNGVK